MANGRAGASGEPGGTGAAGVTAARREGAATVQDLRAWLVRRVAELRDLPASAIDPRERLAAYGLDSAEAAVLTADLETWLGVDLPPELVWDNPTIETVATALGQATAPGGRPDGASPVAPGGAGE
jgi:phthiocerol/phenolphthiocerol synthesis type-I polyketide synthase D